MPGLCEGPPAPFHRLLEAAGGYCLHPVLKHRRSPQRSCVVSAAEWCGDEGERCPAGPSGGPMTPGSRIFRMLFFTDMPKPSSSNHTIKFYLVFRELLEEIVSSPEEPIETDPI